MKIQFRTKTDSGMNELLDESTEFHFSGINPDEVDGEVIAASFAKAIKDHATNIHPGDSYHVVSVDEEGDYDD